ncbi:MAG: CheR family methyltransferase [Ruminiclostridium sp.]
MKPITEKEFLHLVDYIKINFGVELKHKKTLVTGRLQNYLTENNFGSFTDYIDYVLADKTGNASAQLINKLTTNHTFFMRETQHFKFFKEEVLPNLKRTENASKDLRIWSAGCSTGEEPYTLAMIIADFLGLDKTSWDSRILATDISTKVLNTATQGVYKNEEISSLPQEWKRNYFEKRDDESSVLIEKIRNEVIYKRFNLINSCFPFKQKFHSIFCRNVMIYFSAETKRELINKFYEYTEEGGYLFIGHSEALNREETNYRYIMPSVFKK